MHIFFSKKIAFEMSFSEWWALCLGLYVLKYVRGLTFNFVLYIPSRLLYVLIEWYMKNLTVDGIGIININISLDDILSVGDSAEGYQLSAIAGPPTNDYIFNTHNSQISVLKRDLWWWDGWDEDRRGRLGDATGLYCDIRGIVMNTLWVREGLLNLIFI